PAGWKRSRCRKSCTRVWIRLCLRLGLGTEARAAYERCKTVLLATLGVAPSPKTERLLQPPPG
ncbi:MAG: bacterial transcriptional activator domain-containing protein, partial [Deferrisomatales bacterium]